MKEKVVLFNAFLMFLLSAMLAAKLVIPAVSVPDIITVPEDYLTIKDAILAAGPGDTIVVHEGLYAEGEIVVAKPLTLRAEGEVIVDGLHTAWSVFRVKSDGVVIDGFIVKNAQYAGIFLCDVDNCRIQGNAVAGINGTGIHIEGCNNVVEGNTILNNDAGIYLIGMFFPTSHNVIQKNIVESNSWGILLIYSDHNVIRQNTLNGNSNASIFLFFSDYNSINENKVKKNGQLGMALIVSHHNLVNENKVTNNGIGIGLSGSGWNTVEENKVNRNTLYGIALYSSYACNTIKKNIALGNKEFDLYWDETGYNTWIENIYKTRNW